MKKIQLFVFLVALLLPLGLFAQEKQNNFEIAKSLDIYNSLLRELNLNYVDEINPGELNENAIKAMLEGLDPYTVFIPESDIENAKFMTTGEYGGIGAIIQYDGEFTRISDPYEGWPAQKAGIIAGDAILEVNGEETERTARIGNVVNLTDDEIERRFAAAAFAIGIAEGIDALVTFADRMFDPSDNGELDEPIPF